MSLLRNFLGRAKGQALSAAGKHLLGAYFERYGAMLHFSVEPDTRTIRLEIGTGNLWLQESAGKRELLPAGVKAGLKDGVKGGHQWHIAS